MQMIQPDATLPSRSNQGQPIFNLLWVAGLLITIFSISFFLFYNQIFTDQVLYSNGVEIGRRYPSDLPDHLLFAKSIAEGQAVIPHPGFHQLILALSSRFGISLEVAAIITLSICITLICCIIFLLLQVNFKDTYPTKFIVLTTGTLMLVSAIYVPFFNPLIYIGQGSPNVWHNPTLIAVKPLGLIIVILSAYFFEKIKSNSAAKLALIISMLLLVSVYVKPNFALIYIPALILYTLITRPKEFRYYWQSLIIVIPSLIALVFQARYAFFVSDLAGNLSFDFLSTWRLYSPNIPISIVLALAFPICVTAFRWKHLGRNPLLVFSWLLTIVGIIQFSILSLQGVKYIFGDWMWGYLIGMQLLFVFSVLELLKWNPFTHLDEPGKMVGILIVSSVYLLHLLSGVYYLTNLLNGKEYF